MAIDASNRISNGQPRRVTKEIRRWWNLLASDRPFGRARYTRAQLEKIARSDERRNPLMKRIAAQHLLMLLDGGRTSLDVMTMMFDRIEGKVPQRIDLGLDEQPKRIILIDRVQPVATQVAGELEVHDAEVLVEVQQD